MATKEHACYYCLHRFNKSEITEWSDKGKTPHCPKCTIDAVTDGKTTRAELKALQKWWFTGKPVDTGEWREQEAKLRQALEECNKRNGY